jgi:hypothetical protein
MSQQQTIFDQFKTSAAAWLNKRGKDIAKKATGLTEGSEKIHGIAVLPFRELLIDPIGPPPQEDFPKIAGDLPATLNLRAIGVHSAGEYLPSGRHSDIYVTKEALQESARTRGVSTNKDAAFFLDLFNSVYRQLFGRQHTLIHALLHNAENGGVIEIPLKPNQKGTDQIETRDTGDATLKLHQLLPLLATDDDSLDKFSRLLWQNTPEINGHPSQGQPQSVALYAERVAELLRNEEDTTKFWYCFSHTFEKNTHRATDKLEQEIHFAPQLLGMVFGPTTHPLTEHALPSRLRDAVIMLQLFFLYREFCGNWFYVIVPKDQSTLKMCFTVGSNARLDESTLDDLTSLASTVRGELDHYLEECHRVHASQAQFNGEWDVMRNWLREKRLNALSDKGLKKATPEQSVTAGLPQYLLFANRVAELAVHEGKKLHFDIVVSNGIFASEKLLKISSLWAEGGGPWPVIKGAVQDQQPNEDVVSHLLGNYSFMQQKGVVLYGSRDGHLLYLAKSLSEDLKPEEFTMGGDCYLIRVPENGDLHLFFNGMLVLWRRAGETIVPTLYGRAYRDALKQWLENHFPSRQVDYEILASVVWSLSANHIGGASFVVGKYRGDPFPLEDNAYALSEVFPYAEGLPLVGKGSTELLKRLAIQDGAVVIDVETGNVFGRRQLLPPEPFSWRNYLKQWEKKDGESEWREWHKVLRWGTRHHSALAFSAAAAKHNNSAQLAAAVITVSSDGDIHVFSGNRPEPTLTYPQQDGA